MRIYNTYLKARDISTRELFGMHGGPLFGRSLLLFVIVSN